jgi:hypothetical protein
MTSAVEAAAMSAVVTRMTVAVGMTVAMPACAVLSDAMGQPGRRSWRTGEPDRFEEMVVTALDGYHQAICAVCSSEEGVAEQVRRTVIHEIAHHFRHQRRPAPRTRLVSPAGPQLRQG